MIPCDLEQPDACDRIAEALAAAGVEVEYVVNNAGFGVFGHAVKRDRAEQLDIINVNIRALTDLSLRFADSLIRNRGGILNVGSIAGFLPGPGNGGLLRVQGLCAVVHRGAARRNWRRMACASPWSVPARCRPNSRLARDFVPGFDSSILNVSADEVARQAYDGLMADKRAVLPGLVIKIVPFLLRLFPRSFILAAAAAFNCASADCAYPARDLLLDP